MNKTELEMSYHEITVLFDMAQELLDTVEDPRVDDPEAQLELVEPVVDQVSDAAEVLCDEFIALGTGKVKTLSRSRKTRIETAIRKMFLAIDYYKEQVMDIGVNLSGALVNVADPIVTKLKRQAEYVIEVFLELVDLSLDRIMHKVHVEELKQRQERIAVLVHRANQGLEPVT